MTDPQRIRYRLSASDYVVLETQVRRRLERQNRADRWAPDMLLSGLLVPVLVFLPAAVLLSASEGYVRWAIVYFVLVSWLLPKALNRLLRRRWRLRRASLAQDIDARLTDEALLIDTGNLSSRIGMAAIESGRVLDAHIYLCLEHGNDLVIPLRAFTNPEWQAKWCQQLVQGRESVE